MRGAFGIGAMLTVVVALAGCGSGANRVVAYSSLDREFSEPVLKNFHKKTGVRVDAKYDVESTKTVGLTQLLVAESGRPRCDLFWNNEIINTLRLRRGGLLAPFHPPSASGYPDAFKAKDGTWYGFAARARVLIVNTSVVAVADRPKGLLDLTDPKWRGKIGIAKPLFGTTATHAACLFSVWGPDKAKEFFRALKSNGVHVLSGNKQVASAVGSGALAFGLTDTDDAMSELDAGRPVALVYPDRAPGELGTLFIPNTLSILKDAPHRSSAEALAEFLLAPGVESSLARGPSSQIPLNPAVTARARVETPSTVTPMIVDWEAAVDHWDEAMSFLAGEFAG